MSMLGELSGSSLLDPCAVVVVEHDKRHRPPDSAGQLFLTFQALAAHPSAFPQMTRFITGLNPGDPEFRAQRVEFLRGLARYLCPPVAPTATRPVKARSLADDRT